MKKETYVAPETEMRIVELEQGFMSSSVYPEPENTESLEIKNHEVDETFDFTQGEWDN